MVISLLGLHFHQKPTSGSDWRDKESRKAKEQDTFLRERSPRCPLPNHDGRGDGTEFVRQMIIGPALVPPYVSTPKPDWGSSAFPSAGAWSQAACGLLGSILYYNAWQAITYGN